MAAEPDLSRLILDAKGDRSYERMSLDCGGLPTDKRLQQMATTPLRAFPDVATIRGIARGTGTTETAVVLAAARSLGLRVHSGTDPSALVIGGADDLRPEQRETIAALVRVFRETNIDVRRRRLEAAMASSQQRYDATIDILSSIPIDGPDRARERAIIARAAIEASEELESMAHEELTDGLPPELVSAFDTLRQQWLTTVDEIINIAAKYPPFNNSDDVTRDNLNRVIHGSAGSGKSAAILEFAQRDAPEPAHDSPPFDPEDYDEKAASWSPEPAGQPEPEQP